MRRRWRIKARREGLSPAMRLYLELGPGGLCATHERSLLDGYAATRFFDGERVRAAAWREDGAAITAAWALKHPGTRPWGWWAYDAATPRRCVVGTELLMPRREPTDWQFVWRASHGIPAFRQSRPPGFLGLPSVESQAQYLDRLGLLGIEERSDLDDDAFVPKDVHPFILDDEETP